MLNWQLFPIFMIKAVVCAGACVGIVGAILAGFFMVMGHVAGTYGHGWAFLTALCGIAFVICSVGFTCFFMDQHIAKQKEKV